MRQASSKRKTEVTSYSVISYNNWGKPELGWSFSGVVRAQRLVRRLLTLLEDTGYLVCDHGNGVFTAIHTRSHIKRTLHLNKTTRTRS